VHRGGRPPEERPVRTRARQPVAQNPIDQADGRRRGNRRRERSVAVGRAPPPADDDATPASATARRSYRHRGRRIRATRLGRGHPVRELQAADVQVYQRDTQRRMVRLVGREAKEVGRAKGKNPRLRAIYHRRMHIYLHDHNISI